MTDHDSGLAAWPSLRRAVTLGATCLLATSALTGCIEEPLGIAYRVDGRIYIQAPCGDVITHLEVWGDDGQVAVFEPSDSAFAPPLIGLTPTTEGLTILGPLVGDLTATIKMPYDSSSSAYFVPDDLREGYATTGLFSGTMGEVFAHVQKKCR